MSIKEILRAIEDAGFTVHEYHEDGKLCGYEIETWTDDIGIDMIHFIDCRDTFYSDGITPENIAHELQSIYTDFDPDDEAVTHWENYKELHGFGIGRIVRDFEAHDKKLEALWLNVSA